MRKSTATIRRGNIVLVPFPFTDLSAVKVRPSVVISADNTGSADIVAAFISSKVPRTAFKDDVPVTRETDKRSMGLKTDSLVKCRKIVTLDRAIILGELGVAPPAVMKEVDGRIKIILGLF